MQTLTHLPVLLEETLDLLNLRAGSHVIDGTLGLGGHSLEILKRIGPKGQLIGIDQDEANLELAKENLRAYQKQITLIHGNFSAIEEIMQNAKWNHADAILMDLGLSSPHVDDAERGFSFQKEGPLDMRFDRSKGVTAETIVNRWPEKELAGIFWDYGEERQAKRMAHQIIVKRKEVPFHTTRELAELFAPEGTHFKRHPATRIFQALRIAVNRELESLEKGLESGIQLLAPKGRIAVIAYHSLEDRMVKNRFRYYTRDCVCPNEIPVCQCDFEKKLYIVTKKPIIPSGIEVDKNPRSRSAKLRVAEKIKT